MVSIRGQHRSSCAVTTTFRPDLVVVNKTPKKVILFELSLHYEINIDDAHQWKVERYGQLISDIEDKGYEDMYYHVEIGSRSHITKDNINKLTSFMKDTATKCKIVIIASFVVYHSKFEEP